MKTLRTALTVPALALVPLLAMSGARADRLVYEADDGTRYVYGPEDDRWPVANVAPGGVLGVTRPGDDPAAPPSRRWLLRGVYAPPAFTPATQPATRPVPQAATLPATVPVVVTPPPPVVLPPVLDPAKTRVAPNQKHRGDGWTISRPGTYKDLTAIGFEQNVVVQGFSGDVTLEGLVSCDSWDDDTWNRGQLLYADFDGVLTLTNSLLWGGGWQDGRPPETRSWFKHAGYVNAKVRKVVVRDSVIGASAAAAIQARCDLELVDSVVIDCGTGINPVLGKAAVKRVTVYGTHRYFDGSNWTGAFALTTYTDTDVDDLWIVAGPRAADPLVPGAKGYDMGPVAANRKHPQYPTTGGRITARNSRIVGPWRSSDGQAFAGDMGFDGRGFELVDRPPVVVDYLPVVNRMRTRELSVPDGRRLLDQMIRDAAAAK